MCGSYQHPAVYRFSRACKLTAYTGTDTVNSVQAKFILPDISKLSAEIKSGSLSMLLVSCGTMLFTCLVVDDICPVCFSR